MAEELIRDGMKALELMKKIREHDNFKEEPFILGEEEAQVVLKVLWYYIEREERYQ